jgi:hypothetical protein
MKLISDYTDPDQLRQLMKNVKAAGREDLYWQAFNRLCVVEGGLQDVTPSDPLSRDFYATLAAYEELLTAKNGKRTKASQNVRRSQSGAQESKLIQLPLACEGAKIGYSHGSRCIVVSVAPETTAALVVAALDRGSA